LSLFATGHDPQTESDHGAIRFGTFPDGVG
jgi:hypothetical protein